MSPTLVGGELQLTQTGNYGDYLTSFLPTWCEFSLAKYGRLRFQLRASGPSTLTVMLAMGNGSCPGSATTKKTWTIVTDTTKRLFELDLTGVTQRDKALWLELDVENPDGVSYW